MSQRQLRSFTVQATLILCATLGFAWIDLVPAPHTPFYFWNGIVLLACAVSVTILIIINVRRYFHGPRPVPSQSHGHAQAGSGPSTVAVNPTVGPSPSPSPGQRLTALQAAANQAVFYQQLGAQAQAQGQSMTWSSSAYGVSYTPLDTSPLGFPEPETMDDYLVGWRIWRVTEGAQVAILQSWAMATVWPPGLPMKAGRLTPVWGGGMIVPGGYTPGIMAMRTADLLAGELGTLPTVDTLVFGRVALWGDVYEHEKGLRAEFAYPLKIYGTSGEVLRKIASTYGCETELYAGGPRFVAD